MFSTIVGVCLLASHLATGAARAQIPFACTGEAFIVQNVDAELSQVDQSVSPFIFLAVGPPAGTEYNSMGFRRTDGLLYAVELRVGGNVQIIRIDSTGAVFGLGRPSGLPAGPRFDAGDVTPDGTTMYINTVNQDLYALDLTTLPTLPAVTSVPVTGPTGFVFDWAVNPTNGLLYGGDSSAGQLAVLDPATGIRIDSAVAGCAPVTPDCTATSLPSGTAFGGAWFNAAGRLFLYQNSGFILEIDLSGPAIVRTQVGPGSSRNDGAACVQDVFGAAKSMAATMDGIPETVTIDYVFENLSPTEDLFNLTVIDDLAATFGTHGSDWSFTSISSVPASFANSSFDGHSDTELVNQLPAQDLPAGALALVIVEIEVLNFDNLDVDGDFCNQVLAIGETLGDNAIGDLSTDGLDPDPDGDGSPDERDPSCVPFTPTPAIDLVKSGAQDPAPVGDPGITEAGDAIDYTFQITNTGNVTLTAVTISDPTVSPISCPGGHPIPTLAPLASETCTGTYTVTQADVDGGHKDNTAATTGQDPSGNPVSDQDSHSEPITQVAAIRLVKTGTLDLGADGLSSPGDLIDYTFEVTNTGNVPLTAVTVSDPMLSPISCPSGSPIPTLAPGASETCTGSYAITQADIDAGQKDNTATATDQDPGGNPVSDQDSHSEPIPTPLPASIQLVKTGALDLGGNGVSNPGDPIDYTFQITNTGGVVLSGVTVSDPMVSPISCPSGNPIPSLAPGASETCTGSYAITQADIDAGQKDNTATVTGQDPGGNPVSDQDSHSEPIPPPVLLEVPCTGEAFIVQNVDAQLTQVDQTTSPFTFINIGLPLGIEVNNLGFRRTDGLLYAVELNPGGNTQILQLDRNGVLLGLGRPSGLPSGLRFDAGDVSTDGSKMYITTVNQALYIVDLTSVPVLPPVTVVPISGATGFVFDWAYNPIDGLLYGGDSTSGQLAVLDPATGGRSDFALAGLPSGVAYGGAWFNAAGGLFLYRNNGEIYEIDVAGLTVVDFQTGPGSSRNDGASCVQDVVGAAKEMTATTDGLPETVTIDYVFENLSASDDLFDLATADDLTASFGTHGVDWTFTSIASVPAGFANPSFDGHLDTELVNQVPPQALTAGSTATVTVAVEVLTFSNLDVDGNFCNQVLVTAETAAGTLFGDLSTDGSNSDPDADGSPDERDPSCVGFGPQPASIALVKGGTLDFGGDGVANAGDLIDYTFQVTNSGTVTLTGVTVSDPTVSPILCPGGHPIPALAPGTSATCTGSYAVTQADVDTGIRDNTATVTADDPGANPVSDQASHSEPIPRTASVALVKTGALDLGGDGLATPGDPIDYTFAVTNTGNVTLTNVSINDAMVSPISCPSGSPIPALAPATSEICTASYAITQADIDAGFKNNTATAAGLDPGTNPVSDQDSHSQPIGQPAAAIQLVKTGALDLGGDGVANPGDVIDYSFQVTNAGSVTLTAVSIVDAMVAVTMCPSGHPIPSLAPTASETCTGIYVLTQADVDAGIKINAATVTGQDPGANPVSGQDSHNQPIPPAAAIRLAKNGSLDLGGDGIATPGDPIDYTFQITNTGNVTLAGISVSDAMVTISCPSGEPIPALAPGASEICTGSVAITQADIDAGFKINTATVAGQDPGGNPVGDQDTDSESIPSPGAPVPFPCTGEAFIVQNVNAQLTQIDQSVSPFVFLNVGSPTGVELNNLGFRRTDGLLYAVELTSGGNTRIVQIDSNATVFGLGRPAGLPSAPRFDAGDVSTDGGTMYVTTVGQPLFRIALPSLTSTSVAITGATGNVFDWAYHPTDGLLYGGDSSDGELAILDPVTGARTDVPLAGLPAGAPFGGAWFNASGRLFLYQNLGFIFEIDLAGPAIVDTQSGPGSTRNDAAACVQDAIGAAKQMTATADGLPETVTIDYGFENFSAFSTLSELSGVDDLSAVFGTHGADWTFTSIASSPAGFANPGFDGHSDAELVNQTPTQSLPVGASAIVTVTLELLTFDRLGADGNFCNQVVAIAEAADAIVGDLSTDGTDPDPDSDGSPGERDLACLPFTQAATIDLVKTGALDLGGDGIADPGDSIDYAFQVSNTGNVTLTDVTVSDPMVSIGCPGGHPIAALAPAASVICTGSYALTQADIDAGVRNNTATVTGDDPGANPAGDQDSHSEPIPRPGLLDLVKTGALDRGSDGIANPGDLILYTLQVSNSGSVTLTEVTVDDPMVSPISCPGGLPIPSLGPGAAVTCSASYALTQADIDAGVKDNTATATALDPSGNPVADQDSHSEPIFTPQPPFACTGEAFIVQDVDARLSQVDQSIAPFGFVPLAGPAGIELNNLGFRTSDGLLYAVELNPGGNVGIVQIDASGAVVGLGRPAGLPAGTRFDAGDVSVDGDTMYITANHRNLYLLDLTNVPALPAVTAVAVTGDSGFVFDWAHSAADGLLYGGDSSHGELAILDPATGVRSDLPLAGLPAGVAFGGAWFDATGRLFLYRNSGEIYEIDLLGLTIVGVQTGPGSTRNDAASCAQNLVGAAKQMAATAGALPAPVTISYLFESFSTTVDLFNLSAVDDLEAVFGTHGVDWTFTSISSTPAAFANPAFDGHADTELINPSPVQSLPAGTTASITVTLEVLATENVNLDGQFCNQVVLQAENAGGTAFGDLSTAGIDPDPDGDGSPDEREPACVALGQSSFGCGEAYIIQDFDAQLTLVDQSVSPFVFIPVSGPAGTEINNLGLRTTDGLMYAVELSSAGNVQIVQIDSAGSVVGLGRPAGLPTRPRFDAGDVSSDGTTMYITANNQDLYLLDLTALPALPPVTRVTITGSRGFVFDWAYNPVDGQLYGGDSTHGTLAILDPATGVWSDVPVPGLPSGVAYGGAWFGSSGNLFLYLNSGTIYEIELTGPSIVGSQSGPGSGRNDAAACVP